MKLHFENPVAGCVSPRIFGVIFRIVTTYSEHVYMQFNVLLDNLVFIYAYVKRHMKRVRIAISLGFGNNLL